MIDVLIILAIILGATQRGPSRLTAAAIFLTAAVGHGIIGPHLGDWAYYVTAGAGCFIVLGLLVAGGLHDQLSMAAWVGVLLNLFGWALWVSYQDPAPYDWAFLGYWAWVLWILYRGSRLHGVLKNLRDDIMVRRHALSGLGVARKEALWKG